LSNVGSSDIVMQSSHTEGEAESIVKKVEERNINISNNIKNHEETRIKENILPDFKVEISTDILDKNKDILLNNSDIFTDDLPDLEKIKSS
jgi:hypothetical protein